MLKCLNVCHVKNEDQYLLFGIGIYFLMEYKLSLPEIERVHV